MGRKADIPFDFACEPSIGAVGESLAALAGPGAWREPGLRVVGAARVAAP